MTSKRIAGLRSPGPSRRRCAGRRDRRCRRRRRRRGSGAPRRHPRPPPPPAATRSTLCGPVSIRPTTVPRTTPSRLTTVEADQVDPVELVGRRPSESSPARRRSGRRAAPRRRCGRRCPRPARRCRRRARATSRISSERGSDGVVAGAGPAGRRYQRRAEQDRLRVGEANGWTLNQPLSPQASPMRPTSRASAGQPASAMSATRPRRPASTAVRRAVFACSTRRRDGRRHLGAVAGPVLDPVEGDPQRLLGARGDRVVEADALDEAPVATQARVGDDDVEEGALLRTATCKPDHDHVIPSKVSGRDPAKNRAL